MIEFIDYHCDCHCDCDWQIAMLGLSLT